MTTFGYTILYVNNVQETLEFYTKAFGFEQKLITPEKDYGELNTGSTILAFASYSIAEYNGLDIQKRDSNSLLLPPFEITFVVDDIEISWRQAVEAGAKIVKQPEPKPWGQMVGYLTDLNGFLVELCTKMGE